MTITTTIRPWRRQAITLALLAATAARLPAQSQPPKDDPQDFVADVLKSLLGPNWNAFVHGGATTQGRLLLQRPNVALPGERELTTKTGYDVGIGGGVDFLLHTGVRFSYTYSNSDLKFLTNNGNGSTNLDIDNVGTLKGNTLAIEVMRYMLPSRATITPYGTVGFVGNWWNLSNGPPNTQTAGGSTQFRGGALVSFGVQVKVNDHWNTRLEWASASVGNPFSGNHSFTAPTGLNVDEPTTVNKTDYRLGGVYYFGKTKVPTAPVMTKR